jgi:hypothetical protein
VFSSEGGIMNLGKSILSHLGAKSGEL